MSNGRNGKKEHYYFVTLETRGRKNLFADEKFRTRVERQWIEVMRSREGISGEEYAVNDRAVHALVLIAEAEGQGEEQRMELLHASTGAFMDLARKGWKGEGELWGQSHKYRRIEKEAELRSLREFIVQKMLGGQEINDLDDLAEDEDY